MILDILKRLTDNYIKIPTSNTYKLIKIFADELTEAKEALELTEEWRDIEKAEGATLDLLGADLGEPRRNRNDSDYRNAILFAIIKSTSGGDIERLNEIFETAISGYIGIREGFEFEHPLSLEPAALLIKILAQDTNNIPFEEINSVIAAGIRAHYELLYGANVKAKSEFQAAMADNFEANIKIKSEFEAAENTRTFAEVGALNSGEGVVLP